MPDFTALNQFFDHIYVISLKRTVERQAKIVECLDGLDYTFFYGVDKKEFTMDELLSKGIYDEDKAKSYNRYDKPMNTSQIGCAWSHRLVYEDMLQNKYKKVLVLEDNVICKKEGLLLANEMIEQLPNNWELWYLDYHKNLRRSWATYLTQQAMHFQKFIGKLKWSHKMIDNLFARKYSNNLFQAGYHNLSCAYAITDSAAEKLIALQTPVAFCAESVLAYACANQIVSAYVAYPKLFLKESFLQELKNKVSYTEE